MKQTEWLGKGLLNRGGRAWDQNMIMRPSLQLRKDRTSQKGLNPSKASLPNSKNHVLTSTAEWVKSTEIREFLTPLRLFENAGKDPGRDTPHQPAIPDISSNDLQLSYEVVRSYPRPHFHQTSSLVTHLLS
jgi:hypothetical protein